MGISGIQDNGSHAYHYPTLNPTIFSKFEEGEGKKKKKTKQTNRPTKNLKVTTNLKFQNEFQYTTS
jgi:hypothetical protein